MDGVEIRDDGTAVLRVRVSAVPDKGKANAAVVALLARVLGVSKSSIRVTSGETSRLKTISIAGTGSTLVETISKLTTPPMSPRP